MIKLSDKFTYGRLIRFVLPSVIMMIFTSVYSIVDGLFVSNFAGKTPFSAINLIMPVLMVLGSVGFMVGTGGSAIVAKTLGEKRDDDANRYFSLLVYFTFIFGVILAITGIALMPLLSKWLGAEGDLLYYCVQYERVVLCALPFFMLQNVFQAFMVTAEKPKIGLAVTVIAGVTNMIFDALFVAVFNWGLVGAAVATALSQFVGGFIPILYFLCKNSSLLRLGKTKWYGKVLLKTCTNGSSELMSNISMSVVTILYNFQLMRLVGENGIAAYGAIMYVGFIFVSIFIGYSIGSAPVIAYNYGAQNRVELRSVYTKSLKIISIVGVVMTILSFFCAPLISKIFVGYDQTLCEMTARGMRIHSLHFLICGFNIFGSGFFTALNNGAISACISFLRTLVFQCTSILILAYTVGLDGVWSAVIVAELGSLILTVIFMLKNGARYGYSAQKKAKN